jgi:hypothetical protein
MPRKRIASSPAGSLSACPGASHAEPPQQLRRSGHRRTDHAVSPITQNTARLKRSSVPRRAARFGCCLANIRSSPRERKAYSLATQPVKPSSRIVMVDDCVAGGSRQSSRSWATTSALRGARPSRIVLDRVVYATRAVLQLWSPCREFAVQRDRPLSSNQPSATGVSGTPRLPHRRGACGSSGGLPVGLPTAG